MTISKSAWRSFLQRYRRCIQPDPETGVTARDIELKVGVQLCVNDILGQLRGTSISYYRDSDGAVSCSTCRQFLERVFADVFDTLEKTGVEVYVVSMDAYGKRLCEKAATTAQRAKRSRPEEAPEQLPMPPDQRYYFLDAFPMPGPVNMIFDTPAAKREFYVYMTLFFTLDETQARIPPGKRIILSGGSMELSTGFANLAPLEITRDGWNERQDWLSPDVGEGDIDVWTWVYRFPHMNFYAYSCDADVFLIGLLQMRRLLKKTPGRRGWAVTRRSVDTHAIDESYKANLDKRHCLRKEKYDTVLAQTQDRSQAYIAAGGSFAAPSSAEPSSARRPSWVHYHIDLVQVYQDIVKDARRHIDSERTPTVFPEEVGAEPSADEVARQRALARRIKFCPNFVEIYVLAFILASDKHDYIQTKLISRNVGSQFVWTAFEKRMYAFGNLVEVYKQDMVGDNRAFYYVVDKQVLGELVRAFYREKALASIKEENKTFAQLTAAREKSYANNIEKYGPTDSQIWVVASQCAWLLQYWGNGPVPGYKCVSGVDTDVDGNSVYGFTSVGWAESVVESGVKRVCPPLPAVAP